MLYSNKRRITALLALILIGTALWSIPLVFHRDDGVHAAAPNGMLAEYNRTQLAVCVQRIDRGSFPQPSIPAVTPTATVGSAATDPLLTAPSATIGPPVEDIFTATPTSVAATVAVAATSLDLDKIITAFRTVSMHPDYAAAGYGEPGRIPQIAAGCPKPPTLRSLQGKPQTVDTPSPFLAFVFVAPADMLQSEHFYEKYARVTTQEWTCEGNNCSEATSAVYLTPEELDDPVQLVRSLTEAIWLQPLDVPKAELDPSEVPIDGTPYPAP